MRTFYCNTCGHIFEDDFTCGWPCCPNCKEDDYVEMVCKECHTTIKPEDSIDGYCRECLAAKLTYKTGHDFLKKTGYLVDFVFDRLFGAFVPEGDNPEQKAKTEDLASKLFERKACDDLINDQTTVMEALMGYILDDDECYADSFAEWIDRGGKKDD